MGAAFFFSVLRGQLALAAGLDLLLLLVQEKLSRKEGRVAFLDLYRRMMWIYPFMAAVLVVWLYVNGSLAAAAGL
ncbi:hypothetical protein DSY14_08775 [Nocardiopsis sp. MG754419]|nr:hypothetical protein [Nocardiopsis sp. MG754419]